MSEDQKREYINYNAKIANVAMKAKGTKNEIEKLTSQLEREENELQREIETYYRWIKNCGFVSE